MVINSIITFVDFEKVFDSVHRESHGELWNSTQDNRITWFICYTKIVNVQC